jgi:hypothetical protein
VKPRKLKVSVPVIRMFPEEDELKEDRYFIQMGVIVEDVEVHCRSARSEGTHSIIWKSTVVLRVVINSMCGLSYCRIVGAVPSFSSKVIRMTPVAKLVVWYLTSRRKPVRQYSSKIFAYAVQLLTRVELPLTAVVGFMAVTAEVGTPAATDTSNGVTGKQRASLLG